jgi:hypothetical protein
VQREVPPRRVKQMIGSPTKIEDNNPARVIYIGVEATPTREKK